MKIIGIKTNIPSDSKKVNDKLSLPLDCKRPFWNENTCVINQCSILCKQLLFENHFDPLDIDLIINISLNIDNLYEDKNIAMPKVGYPIKDIIGAANAFVFDLYHTDWNTALFTAYNFLSEQNKKNVLIIRADYLSASAIGDYKTGFMIPDGITLVLADVSRIIQPIEYVYLNNAFFNCKQSVITDKKLLSEGYHCRFTYRYCNEHQDDLIIKGKEILKLGEKFNIKHILYESWLPFQKFELDKKNVMKDLASFSLPKNVEKIKKYDSNELIYNICYSPFIGRYSGLIIDI